MSIKTILLTMTIAIFPAASFAMGCSEGHGKQASSCSEGTVWDDTLSACVPSTTS